MGWLDLRNSRICSWLRLSAFCMRTCTRPRHAYPIVPVFMLILHWKPPRPLPHFHAHLALDNSGPLGANHPNQPYAMIAVFMPEVRLHNGTLLRSEDIDHATFWEKGSNSGIKPVGGDRLPVEDDRLHILLKHPTSSKHVM